MRRRVLALFVCASVSCTLPALDLASKGCPCATGYTCDEPSGRCVANGTALPDATILGDGDVPGDSAAPADAIADASSDAPADAAHDSGCPGHPTAIFCDDFDVGALGARWSSMDMTKATLMLSAAQSQSPPSSMLAEIAPPDGGTTGESSAALLLDVAPAPSRVRSTYDVYIDKVGQRSAIIGSVYLHNGIRQYGIGILVHGGGTTTTTIEALEDGDLADGGKYTKAHPAGRIPVGSWTRVVFDLDFGASPTVTVTLEAPPLFLPATPAVDHDPIAPTVDPTFAGTSTTYYAGIDYVLPPEMTGWRFYFDNVVIETP